jgi:hypothetical protein
MSTLNLETDIKEQAQALDERTWTKLQTEVCMNIANAKHAAFIWEAERLAELVRLGCATRPNAADYLHTAAVYNSLYFDYGADHIQAIVSEAFEAAA